VTYSVTTPNVYSQRVVTRDLTLSAKTELIAFRYWDFIVSEMGYGSAKILEALQNCPKIPIPRCFKSGTRFALFMFRTMDIQRPKSANKRRIRRVVYAALLLAGIVMITLGVSRLKPAAPSVPRSTVWIDSVKRGEMLRQVRGSGTLIPEQIRWIPAPSEGRVERILVQPGQSVDPGSVLMVLVNPQLEQASVDTEYQVKAIESDLVNLRVRLESEGMNQQAGAATLQSEYSQARLQLDSDEALAKEGLIPPLTLKLSRVRVQDLANRLKIEQQRLAIASQSVKAQIAAQQARVEQLKALAKLNRSRVVSLQVIAGTAGVVQEVPIEVGQQVMPGTNLARVANPSSLKAELRIAETQAKDIMVGQKASIDTRNGLIAGRVSRIDPAVREGTVVVDAALEGPMPQGVRPDLTVDGTIELEHLNNILYVGRPASGQGNSSVGLFVLESDGQHAVRRTVRLGRSSVNTIEVLEGLSEGEQVILSDTSAWDSYSRIRLN
jgi:HlyD family secretion protein